MSYALRQPDPQRNLTGIAVVVLLHAALLYGLMNGLGGKAVEILKKPLEVSILQELKPPPPPPPKPVEKIVEAAPEKTAPPPPAYVPPPEVQVPETPVENVVSVTTEPPPPAPSPPVEAPSAPVAAPAPIAPPQARSVGVVCPNHMEIRSRLPYPPQAERLGLSGEVVVEFLVGASGKAREVRIVKSTSKVFNGAVTEAVAQFNCVGQDQDVLVRVPFAFKLE